MSPSEPVSALSPEAQRLLEYLRRFAPRPDLARSDRVTANALGLPERSIIDLADELLQAGHVVVARVSFPAGRWLLSSDAPAEHWQEARDYAQSLHSRAIGIMARAKHAREALERMEAARVVTTQGQHNLFGGSAGPSWATR